MFDKIPELFLVSSFDFCTCFWAVVEMNFEQTTAEAANDDIPWFDFSSRPSGGHWRGHQQHWQWISADGLSANFRGKLVGLGDKTHPKKTEIPHVCWNISILRFELWEWRFVVDSFSCQLITDHHLQLGCSSVLHISNMCPEELCFCCLPNVERWDYIWPSTG